MRAIPKKTPTLGVAYELEHCPPTHPPTWMAVGRIVGTLTKARALVRGFRKEYPEGTGFRIVEYRTSASTHPA